MAYGWPVLRTSYDRGLGLDGDMALRAAAALEIGRLMVVRRFRAGGPMARPERSLARSCLRAARRQGEGPA